MLFFLLLSISCPAPCRADSSYVEPDRGFTDAEIKYVKELEKVIRTVRESYYAGSGKEVSVESLVDAALNGLINSLDGESRLIYRRPSSMEFLRGLTEEGSISEAKFLEENTGYIKIDFFGRRTAVDFRKALGRLKGMSGLVIDLRDNTGGILQSALDMLGSFVPDKKLLLTEWGRKGQRQYFSQTGKAPVLPAGLPIAVLINSATASSAEIAAATLRHYRGALIVGQKSHAKGTIQEVISLGAKKTLVLTIGEYILVDGSSLKNSGIIPDHIVKGRKEQLETAVSLLKDR